MADDKDKNAEAASTVAEVEIPMQEDEGAFDVDEALEVIPFEYSITAYGADFPVDGLVKRLEEEAIQVPRFDPESETESGIVGFQRGYVWSKSQADKFIESLLLGLPVPGIFLVSEPNGVLLVLDGQQRLLTLRAFYGGLFPNGREFKLEFVHPRYVGKTYKTLPPEDKRRLDDSLIHATIVRQDKPEGDTSAIYSIFERLNTGGTLLQAQEIRVALFHGKFVRLLRELNENEDWRALYGNRSRRLKDQELILRFFAFYERGDKYTRPMKEFLNDFLEDYRDPDDPKLESFRELFENTVRTIHEGIGDRALRLRERTAVNAALVDSLMVAVAHRLDEKPIEDMPSLRTAYEELLADEDYLGAVERATADEDSVKLRLKKATDLVAAVS